MYQNLLLAMKNEEVTIESISRLIKKPCNDISYILHGCAQDFNVKDAKKIHNKLFPMYDIFFLFERT